MGASVAAKRIKDTYELRLQDATVKARSGDKASATLVIQLMTEMNQALKDINFRITDEEDSVGPGKLVEITEEWKREKISKMSEIDRLFYEARKLPEDEADILIKKAILLMSQQPEA